MRRDYRGRRGTSAIVDSDLADIDLHAVLARSPRSTVDRDEMVCAPRGIRVLAYTGGTPPHPWTVYVAASVHPTLEDAIDALRRS
jgi:hypothetical protein